MVVVCVCVCFGGGLVPKRVVTSVRSDKMETKSRKKKRDKKYPGRPIEYPKYYSTTSQTLAGQCPRGLHHTCGPSLVPVDGDAYPRRKCW